MGSGFWDMGRFSKLPYLGMKLGHKPKCQKLQIHVYPLSTPRGRNWAYFRSVGQRFLRSGQLSYLGMKLGHWPKYQNCCTYTLFPPQGGEIELISALRGFRDMSQFSKWPYLNPARGLLQSSGVCVCVCVCVRPSVNKISQKVFNQSTLFLVETFPQTQGWSDSILTEIGIG